MCSRKTSGRSFASGWLRSGVELASLELSLARAVRFARGLAPGAALAACVTGCLPGLDLVPLHAAASKPSNVAVYFSVDTHDGKPFANLTADQFTLFEDGSLVRASESKQRLLTSKVPVARYTLLLVDMSGVVVQRKENDDLINAVSTFVDSLEKTSNVAVYGFDGADDVRPVVPFSSAEALGGGGIARLRTFKSSDPKSNVNGAVIEGLNVLNRALAVEAKPLKTGALVVFTDGKDRANRVLGSALRAALASSANQKLGIYAVGVGAELDLGHLEDIGRNGTVVEPDEANIAKAFDGIASKVEAASSRYYLLSYCTSARSGLHEVRIEAHSPDGVFGDLTYQFNADGFGAGCDPTKPPGLEAPPPREPVVEEKPAEKKELLPAPKPKKLRAAVPAGASGGAPQPTPPPPPTGDPFAP